LWIDWRIIDPPECLACPMGGSDSAEDLGDGGEAIRLLEI
jgi:hypothetical protein